MINVKVLFLEAPYTGEVELCQETLNYIKKYKKIGLYASIQFVNKLDKVKEQLKEIQNELKSIEHFSFDDGGFNNYLDERIDSLQKWLKDDKKELTQIKEGTKKYNEIKKTITERKQQIKKYKNISNPTPPNKINL